MTTQTSTKWNDYLIRDFSKVKGGKRLPKGQFVQDEKTTHPYIRVTDMNPDRLDTSNIKYITDEQFEKIKRYTISSHDVYVSNAGTIGLVGKVPSSLSGANLTENALKITDIDREKVIQDFIIYFLRSSAGQDQIKARTGGSSQPKLALTRLADVTVTVPDVLSQNKIVDILSAYDNLIENNNRRIKILEDIAQKIYTEWFVNFRFPGYEKVKMVNGGNDFESIPDGWELKKLGDKIELAYGKALKEETRIPGNVLVCGSGGIVGTHNEKLVSGPGIVVGRKGNAGKVFWVSKDFFPIDTAFFVKSELPLEFVLYLMKSQNFVLGDAAVPGLNRDQAYRNNMLLPSRHLIDQFVEKVGLLRILSDRIEDMNLNLRKSRDFLIPQLVTGKLEIKS